MKKVSLVEIAIGVILIALLLYFFNNLFNTNKGKSPEYITHIKLKQLKNIISTYYWQYEKLPDKDNWNKELLDASIELIIKKEDIENCCMDGWNNQVIYLPDTDRFAVYSYGKNLYDDYMSKDDIVVKCSKEELNHKRSVVTSVGEVHPMGFAF